MGADNEDGEEGRARPTYIFTLSYREGSLRVAATTYPFDGTRRSGFPTI